VFDRCDDAALQVVHSAIDSARGLGHNYLGTEHLLFALAGHRDLLPAGVASMLPAANAVRSAMVSVVGEPVRRDAEALRTVGIDLEEVRSAVRRTLVKRRSPGLRDVEVTRPGRRGDSDRVAAHLCWRRT
jgi:hypothetical protein